MLSSKSDRVEQHIHMALRAHQTLSHDSHCHVTTSYKTFFWESFSSMYVQLKQTTVLAWYNSLGKFNTVQNLQHKDKPFAHVFVVFNAVEQKAA